MKDIASPEKNWRRIFWLALLAASSVAFSLSFACAAPFAAFATAAAITQPRKDAYLVIAAVWMLNQLVGFTFLHYPWDTTTLAWGVAIGVSAALSTCAAQWGASRVNGIPRVAIAFVLSFVAYEGALFATALVLGGTADFTLAIKGRMLAINTIALIGLLLLNRAGIAGRLTPMRGIRTPATLRA
jgi:hypothetical protein